MYERSDEAIRLLNKRTAQRFRQTEAKLSKTKFDELNVISEVRMLYDALAADNDEVLLDLSRQQYEGVTPHGAALPDAAWLAALLLAYDPVTKYVYRHEVERKRDRTAEAVNSVTAKFAQMDIAARYWSDMTAQYCDTVVDEATVKAYKDAGVTRVRWVTQADERVCEKCRKRHGKVYPIDDIPPKAHWRCRCYVVPA